MKAFNRLLFSVFILLPCLILGYQNCSELTPNDLASNTQDGDTSAAKTSSELPVFLNDLSLLGYSQPSSCSPDSISALKLYSEDTNICTEANDSCEAYYLIQNGYTEDQTGACNNVVHPEDESFLESMKSSTASSEGFSAKTGQMCTMQFAQMISFKTRTCASAGNGCEISFLSAQGYVQDKFGICN